MLSLSYLICSYFAVFSLVQISTIMIPPACSAPLEAWQGLAHVKDTWPHPKPCSDFSAFTWRLTCLLPTQHLRWRLCKPCMELSCTLDTLASTHLCSASPHSHRSPYGSLPCWPSASPWTNDWPGGTGHDIHPALWTPKCRSGCLLVTFWMQAHFDRGWSWLQRKLHTSNTVSGTLG